MIFSNTEFYYTPKELISKTSIIIIDDEAKHITRVMRHSIYDEILVTNGEGIVYKAIIKNITRREVIAEIKESYKQKNKMKNITFCIPILKSQDRFEFALEKCVELGITNFIIFSAKKSYKRGVKLERWNKILLAAMKQSLQSFKPKIDFVTSLSSIVNNQRKTIVLEQNADETLSNYLKVETNQKELFDKETYFIFGPEGGLVEEELNFANHKLQLTENRLRAETAIIATASLINQL